MEPARTIIIKLGGPSAVAGIVNVHRTRPYDWMRSREDGGTGGLIPQAHHVVLLRYAAENAIDLRAEDFLPDSVPTPEAAS